VALLVQADPRFQVDLQQEQGTKQQQLLVAVSSPQPMSGQLLHSCHRLLF
jgi:hypothetical protein